MEVITKSDVKRKRIAAVGMWDGVHLGHQFLISFVVKEGKARGLVPAIVTFDRHPLSLVRPSEEPQLLSTLLDKEELLARAGAQDCIVLNFDEPMRRLTAREFLKMLHRKFSVSTLILGFNNRLGSDQADNLELYRQAAAETGVEVIQAPEYKGQGSPISSSKVRALLSQGKVDEATEVLGRPYMLRGRVVQGNQMGRQIGFPTANVVPAENNLLIPGAGVYAVKVTTPDGISRAGMANIGLRPTVCPDQSSSFQPLTIEAHIFDYNGYLYDEEIAIEFLNYMRPEKKFSSLSRLKTQLTADAKKARKAAQ